MSETPNVSSIRNDSGMTKLNTEQTRTYEELLKRGWTPHEARHIVEHQQGSLTYAQARLMGNVRELGRAIAKALRW